MPIDERQPLPLCIVSGTTTSRQINLCQFRVLSEGTIVQVDVWRCRHLQMTEDGPCPQGYIPLDAVQNPR